MFIYLIQFVDLLAYGSVGLFLLFFTARYLTHFIKLHKAHIFWKHGLGEFPVFDSSDYKVSVIIPVVDEPLGIWELVLTRLKSSLSNYKNQKVIVVANGGNGVKNAKMAEDMGFEVIRLKEAGKRKAIQVAVNNLPDEYIQKDKCVTVILDSDTITNVFSVQELLNAFQFPDVGGATPTHKVFDSHNNLMRVISNWLEDIRFKEVVSGQSIDGAISCLPGRLLAIRTHLLKQASNALVSQTFLGNPCISGDDRFLTSWLLERGHKCVYASDSVVETNAPDTLSSFAKQRLRWSRTSLRETFRSLPWIFNYPYTAFTVLTNVILRWVFFVVLITGIMAILGFIDRSHYLHFSTLQLIVGTILGFVVSGTILQIGHLRRYPQDVKYLLPFLFITTFVLTPVEWFGNLTLKESGWLTRDLHGDHE